MSHVLDEVNPSAEIIPFTEETLSPLVALAGGGVITATSLAVPAEMEYDTFEALGAALGGFDRACRWWVGDWLISGEAMYPEQLAQAATHTGLSETTLLNRVWLARAIPPSRRRAKVSYSCHAVVAPLSAREQTRWLTYAETNGSTVAQLKAAIKLARAVEPGESGAVETHDVVRDGEPDLNLLLEAAGSLVRNAQDAGENIIVRKDDFVRIVAALGWEEGATI